MDKVLFYDKSFVVTQEDSFKMDNNNPDGKDNQQEATKAGKQEYDKGLGDGSFRKKDRLPACKANDGKIKSFLSELKAKQGKEQESGPCNKKLRFLTDTTINSTPCAAEFMDQDDSFRQLMNKLNKPQFLKQGKGDSAKNFNFNEDFSAQPFTGHGPSATSTQDNSSGRLDDVGKMHYGPEPSMEVHNDLKTWKDKKLQLESGADFEKYLAPNSNQPANEGATYAGDAVTVKSNANREQGHETIRLKSGSFIGQTLSGILNEEREMFENWRKVLSKLEACEVKLLQRGCDTLSEAERMRDIYQEQKDKFQRKLSAISNVLTKSHK